jgi:signal transduction histidine kinase
MKVRTSLFLLSAIFVIIIVVLGYVMLNTSNLVNKEVRESESATQIIKDIFELNIVTYEYLTYHEEEIDLSLSSEKRLSSQALIRSQRMASEAFKFSALNEQRIAQVQQRTNSIALFSIIGFIVLSFSISFFTSKAIIGPLNKLVKSAEIIGKGNLEHRVDIKNRNEIGELAVAFNRMTEQRKQAAEALKDYSQHLEEKVDERTQELRDAQESLVRKERLAILGQLAGGVGHELRNPLGVISNAVYYLQAINPESDETTQEYLNIISSEVRDAEKIISDLLDFARTRTPERRGIGVSELVAKVLERKPPPEDVQVKTEFPEDLPEVYVDPDQINLVLINLVVNAYQAMLEGGKLVIEADVIGDEVRLAIKDDGIGISPDHMKKLFEPLFTTKAKGIGLGLAVTKNLVETNQGTIKVESVKGVGSTFTVILPAGEVVS